MKLQTLVDNSFVVLYAPIPMLWEVRDKTEIGRRIRARREEMGYTQKQFAAWLSEQGFELSERTLQRHEAGEFAFKQEELRWLGQIISISFDDIILNRFGQLMEHQVEARRALTSDQLEDIRDELMNRLNEIRDETKAEFERSRDEMRAEHAQILSALGQSNTV